MKYLFALFTDEKGVDKPSAVMWIQSLQKPTDQLRHLLSILQNIVYNNLFVLQEWTQPWKYFVKLEMDNQRDEKDWVTCSPEMHFER